MDNIRENFYSIDSVHLFQDIDSSLTIYQLLRLHSMELNTVGFI